MSWVCLNSDDAVKSNRNFAGCGGLIRDHEGNWLVGFTKKLGVCSPFIAELWGLYKGIKLCLCNNWYSVVVQIDAAEVVNVLNFVVLRGGAWFVASSGYCILH